MNTKPRKPTGSFLNDHSSISNLYHQNPRHESSGYEKGPFTIANHTSNTNFIGGSVLSEGPRAVSVSESGEKHSLQLENDTNMNNTNPVDPLSAEKSRLSVSCIPSISRSSTAVPNMFDRTRSSSTKRSRGVRRYINQKPRTMFTPRNLDRITSRSQSEDRPTFSQNFNAQTQTDIHSSAIPSLLQKHTFHSTPIIAKPPGYAQQPLRAHPRFVCESVGDVLMESQHLQPLRILTTNKKSKMKDFSELRSIVSALTLITVVSWFFSIFFELEGIVDIFRRLVDVVQSWYVRREQPMTKAEWCVQYIRSWWT